MARKRFVAGNWKMNTTRTEALELVELIRSALGDFDAVDVAVCPPYVYLGDVADKLFGSNIGLGAQNCNDQDSGAFTGEISANMLRDMGCRYVILGHSERRHVFGESDEFINRKIIKALEEGLDVIFCVGETLDERKAEKTIDVVRTQITEGLKNVDESQMDGMDIAARLTIAYEPVWAIGTGETATPQQAQEVHAAIRKLLAEMYDEQTAEDLRIQYGGSVKPGNAAELFAQPDIDGGLIGGASLKSKDFVEIIKAGL